MAHIQVSEQPLWGHLFEWSGIWDPQFAAGNFKNMEPTKRQTCLWPEPRQHLNFIEVFVNENCFYIFANRFLELSEQFSKEVPLLICDKGLCHSLAVSITIADHDGIERETVAVYLVSTIHNQQLWEPGISRK